jgi:1,4-dihydroxy-2-naphthoate octaprenyltransferase
MLKFWFIAGRPKTLTASISPVLVGSAMVSLSQRINWTVALVTLFSALFIQLGTNYSNDYYDFLKGADKADRKGPKRILATGEASEKSMLIAAFLSFTAAALLGIFLVIWGGWPILIIGIVSLLSGFFYTAGPYPLAYVGLGDLFVFWFFGPVAVLGTAFLQTGGWDWRLLIVGTICGLLCTTILIVNNLRDVDEDRAVNKRTLAVRFGTKFTMFEYLGCCLGVSTALIGSIVLFGKSQVVPCLILVPMAVNCINVFKEQDGDSYNQLLENSAKLLLIYAVLVIIGVLVF